MKKLALVGFALLMVFAVFVPFVSANDGAVDGMGTLVVQLACRSPQIGGEFTIAPVIVSAPFTDAARVDNGFVDAYVKVVGEATTEQYLPDGTFDTRVEPGTYLLKQIDGNGGQPEFALVTIGAGEKETVVFLGHGISGITANFHPVFVITLATYGAQTVVIDQAAVPGVPAVTHTVHHAAIPAVPAQPAYDEYVHVGHNQGDYDKHTFMGNTYYTYEGNNHGDYDKVHHNAVPATPAVPAYDEVIIDSPAIPAVPEISHIEGTFVSVKAQVQALADGGQLSFKFDNAQNPGGIFDTENNLLKQINDPAPGQVKTVKIKYTVYGGATQTINAQEYQTINLV
jgi:hypothetical protein